MPELPEVETIVKDLNMTQPPILGAGFLDVWTDFMVWEYLNIIKGRKLAKI